MKSLLSHALSTVNQVLIRTISKKIVSIPKVRPRSQSQLPYDNVLPHATYAPWLGDPEFQSIHEIVQGYTLVDRYRLYELYSLAKQLTPLEGVVLEVGVWRGGSSAVIQKALQVNGDSDRKLYIADTFTGVVKASGGRDSSYRGGEHADTSVGMVEEVFAKADLPLPVILKGIFPDDHPTAITEKICLLHSDVDAYDSTKDIVEWAIPRLSDNALMVFDDYGFQTCDGVTNFCNELKSDSRFIHIHNLNGHAIFLKK